jgi:arginyl-tRNA synthetase
MVKELVEKKLQDAVEKLVTGKKPQCDIPANSSFGDYTSNIAMQLSKELKRNPYEIAQEIANNIQTDDVIKKVDVIKPGFINIWISESFLQKNLSEVLSKKEKFGSFDFLNKRKVILEFTDPNPFKEFHIGHVYVISVGESISRLYEALDADVRRVNYQGDVGMHVAKSIWGMKKKMQEENITIEDLKTKNIHERVNFLGQSYATGATAFEENEQAKEEMKNINLLVYIAAQEYLQESTGWEPQVDYKKYLSSTTMSLDEVKVMYTNGRSWSLEYFEILYKRLGTKYDHYYFESVVGEYGVKIVREFLKKGIFKESDGAIIFPGEKYGLHTRVFINSLGLPTYEAKELGLAPTKYKDFQYDESIIITGNEIDDYFKVLLTALKQTNPELGEKTKHISHGMVRLPEGKMSSRTGKVITGESLLNEVKEQVKEIVLKSEKVDKNQTDEISETIAIGAVKYWLLKADIGRDIIFDFKESLSLEGNSGPYLLYSYARCKSILEKETYDEKSLNATDLNDEEKDLLRLMSKFSDIIYSSCIYLSPNLLCNYLFELAQKYNYFYQKHQILKAEDSSKNFRLALTAATAQIIHNGLQLLGIKTVEKM